MKPIYQHGMAKGAPTGHECDCGKFHKWPAYVYAHMDVELEFTCANCGKKTTLFEGELYDA